MDSWALLPILNVIAKLGTLCSCVSRIERMEFPVAASHTADTQMVDFSDLDLFSRENSGSAF